MVLPLHLLTKPVIPCKRVSEGEKSKSLMETTGSWRVAGHSLLQDGCPWPSLFPENCPIFCLVDQLWCCLHRLSILWTLRHLLLCFEGISVTWKNLPLLEQGAHPRWWTFYSFSSSAALSVPCADSAWTSTLWGNEVILWVGRVTCTEVDNAVLNCKHGGGILEAAERCCTFLRLLGATCFSRYKSSSSWGLFPLWGLLAGHR